MPPIKNSTLTLNYVAGIGAGLLTASFGYDAGSTTTIKPWLIFGAPVASILFSVILISITARIASAAKEKEISSTRQALIKINRDIMNSRYTNAEQKAEAEKELYEITQMEARRLKDKFARLHID